MTWPTLWSVTAKKGAADKTDQYRNRIEKALQKNRRDDRDTERYDGDAQVRKRIILHRTARSDEHSFFDRRRCKIHADDDDDRADNDRRKRFIDPAFARKFNNQCDDAVKKPRADRTSHRIGRAVLLADADERRNKRERRTQKRRYFRARDEDVDERSGARGKKRSRRTQARQKRYENRRAEHGEHVLKTQRDPLRDRRFVMRP